MWEKRVGIISGCHNRALFHYKITESCIKNCIVNSAVQHSTRAFPATKCVSPFSAQGNKKERNVVKSSLYWIYIDLFMPFYPCKASLFLLCSYTAPYTFFFHFEYLINLIQD